LQSVIKELNEDMRKLKNENARLTNEIDKKNLLLSEYLTYYLGVIEKEEAMNLKIRNLTKRSTN
jgi:hypothetical protein